MCRTVKHMHRLSSKIMIRAPTAATTLDLLAQAESASRERDTDARVTTTKGKDPGPDPSGLKIAHGTLGTKSLPAHPPEGERLLSAASGS